jgi:hypothetical protein
MVTGTACRRDEPAGPHFDTASGEGRVPGRRREARDRVARVLGPRARSVSAAPDSPAAEQPAIGLTPDRATAASNAPAAGQAAPNLAADKQRSQSRQPAHAQLAGGQVSRSAAGEAAGGQGALNGERSTARKLTKKQREALREVEDLAAFAFQTEGCARDICRPSHMTHAAKLVMLIVMLCMAPPGSCLICE